ncbi:hypothetical protein [Haloarcula sp. CBA1131]|uniref:hypothetical protein n=1 Tax=Haloarcula sp. CBA1131 TaxID=1853686 RepID=UPI001CD9FD20|nr:hypothetical protein [Haloarcula sp. CBA1131]
MTRRSQRHRSTALPFAYRESGLDFDLEGYSVDGKKPVDLDLKAGQKDIDLVSALEPEDGEEPSDWEKVVLYGSLKVPEETIENVFPEEERQNPPAKLYVTLRCHETIYRDRKILADPVAEPGEHEVAIVLYKEDIRGTVELRPYLVRTEDRSGEGR